MKTALSGLHSWIVQRFTAIYMLLFCAFALVHFVFNSPNSYSDWRGWISGPFVLSATTLFFAAMLMHMWIGLRDVAMDYVKPLPLRIVVLAVLVFILVGLALWIMKTLILAPP